SAAGPSPMRPWRVSPDSSATVVSIASGSARRRQAARCPILSERALVSLTLREAATISYRRIGSGEGRLAGGLGFEPRLAESESAVLPLDDPPSGSPRLHSTAAAHLNSWSAARFLQDPAAFLVRPSSWSGALLWVRVREIAP